MPATEEKPFRDRVEVLATDADGRVFGATYPDGGGFGGYGGGVEDGETPTQAAEREFLEETGRTISNVRLLPLPPVEIEWGDGDTAGGEKKKRREKYRGSRTVYATADLGAPVAGVKRERDRHGRKKGTLFSVADAIASLSDEGEFAATNVARKRALRYIAKAAPPVALAKAAAAVYPTVFAVPAFFKRATPTGHTKKTLTH